MHILLWKWDFDSVLFEEHVNRENKVAFNLKPDAEMPNPEFQVQIDWTAVEFIGEYNGFRIFQYPVVFVHKVKQQLPGFMKIGPISYPE